MSESVSEAYAAILGATAPIEWSTLAPHFARGQLWQVTPELDLVQVAEALTNDDSARVKQWMADEQLHQVSDAQALEWHERNPETLWAVVIRPWVLVQERSA
ncbi:DUF2288 domain-containing protein [Halopseudomonas salegens]|uniref:DUF2288 domain-containing protein n=1 Tax=Halopseudomonas salegens TaxID=1434072 RepID=A0A1H2FZF5_9GAMM|nr:DUF2288 domain-containing protein [Halopseudomonas salegens]SDU12729.1 hypothetical protein SAMN05216210_1920 [Halopseudomonas salegens]